ncbi:hypothetical protein [Reyranella sp. CPCC 100927]|uniref:hypothetical protein n=1 Tax=Reyranella sp. CPCC 100927 TaxID=2599616 RepID=UPI0011B72082|nr:hypothetical protein [Reyranella sp. CPCC 100927]TWT06017.1 hypothetical protein FQU96_23480 [Reyranella sp. CPCC 100927]
MKLMFGAMSRAADRWKAIWITDLERRQMAAVRLELDHEYEADNGRDKPSSTKAFSSRLSSNPRA